MKLDSKFTIKNARSKALEDHDVGNVPFISNGFKNNGVIGCVEPLPSDRIFKSPGICVSAFCEATVHKPPFIPRGNGGSGLLVLTPITEMSDMELYYYAAVIHAQKWRFSYGRMVTGDRLLNVDIQEMPNEFEINTSVEKYMPGVENAPEAKREIFILSYIRDIFDIKRGKGDYFEVCSEGRTPLISATMENNGIIGYVDASPKFVAPKITINRVSGDAFVQLVDFVTVPDDVFVLFPHRNLCIEELVYFASAINQHKWRINYCRKLTPPRFNKLKIPLPVKVDGTIDTEYIKRIVASRYGWSTIQSTLKN